MLVGESGIHHNKQASGLSEQIKNPCGTSRTGAGALKWIIDSLGSLDGLLKKYFGNT
jgi:hypothetical protein